MANRTIDEYEDFLYSGDESDGRKTPEYDEENIVTTSVGLARLQAAGATNESRSNTIPRPPPLKEIEFFDVPNVIKNDKLFKGSADDKFVSRLMNEPSIQTVYMLIKPWIITKRKFGGPSDVIQQLHRYGFSHVSTRTVNQYDGMSREIYIEFLLDPFHKQKKDEEKKKHDEIIRRRALREIASRGKKRDEFYENSESDSDDDPDFRQVENDMNKSIALSAMTMDIEEDEIPSFVDERVHFDVVMKNVENIFTIQNLQFHIVRIQK